MCFIFKIKAKLDKHNSEVKAKMDKQHSEVKAKIDKYHSEANAKMEKHNSEVTAQLDVSFVVHFKLFFILSKERYNYGTIIEI